MGWITRMNGKGRIVIPGEVRGKIGIEKGSSLSVEVEDSQIVLSKITQKQNRKMKADELKEFLSKN